MSQFHMLQILGFGLDPLPPYGTMSLNPFFFILKASFSKLNDKSGSNQEKLIKIPLGLKFLGPILKAIFLW